MLSVAIVKVVSLRTMITFEEAFKKLKAEPLKNQELSFTKLFLLVTYEWS